VPQNHRSVTRMTPLTIFGSLRWPIVRRVICDQPPRTILELGCGVGTFGERMAHLSDYLGVEPDETSYRIAAERIGAQGGKVLHGDQSVLPAGATYDLVCVFEVIEHIEDDAAQLEDWLRFVSPGGRIMFSVPAFQERFGPFDESVGHYRRYSPAQMRALLAGAGLTNIRTYLYGWPLGNALDVIRNRAAAKRLADIKRTPIDDRTHASGRTLRLGGAVGTVAQAATMPLRSLYKLTPNRGTGLVAVGQKP
jgi:SAM-dependent methyltransferase